MGIEELVRKNYNKLNENDIYIWHFISENKKKCGNYTIEDMAKHCNVSRTTIMRFAQKLEFSGFSELKVRLKIECEKLQNHNFRSSIADVCDSYHRLINDMEGKDFTSVCNMIYGANRVFVYGTGAVQSFVAQELKRAFLSAQVCIYHIEGRESEVALACDMLTDEDLVIVISLTGESEQAIELAKILKLKNVKTISFTRMKSNTLAGMCDENIYISTSPVDSGDRHYETTSLFFVVVEILVLKYMDHLQKIYEETFGLNE